MLSVRALLSRVGVRRAQGLSRVGVRRAQC